LSGFDLITLLGSPGPCRNLVSHIGSGPGATHCQGLSPYLHLPLQSLPAATLRDPAQLQRDRKADPVARLGAELSFARFDFYDTPSGPVLGEVTVSPPGTSAPGPAGRRSGCDHCGCWPGVSRAITWFFEQLGALPCPCDP